MRDKKDFLYFEEDDTSEMGANGKQVFVTKRINGKTTHNKVKNKENEKNNKLNKKEKDDNDYLIIGIDKIHIPNEKIDESKKRKTSNSSKKNKKNNNNKINNKRGREEKKRKTKNKKTSNIIKICILMILIIGTMIFALVSPTFNIQTITVQGNEKIDTQTIISLSDLQVGNNIFQNLKTDIIEKIKKNPYINEAKVKRILPGTIEIDVKERTVAYQIKVIDSYVYLDYQGYILEKSTEKANVPIIEGISTSQESLLKDARVSNADISYFNSILKIIDNAKNLDIYNLITQINIENNEYILYLESEKKYVYLGDESNITNKMLYVQTIIENEKKHSGKIYVNGNFDNGFKPYFREE